MMKWWLATLLLLVAISVHALEQQQDVQMESILLSKPFVRAEFTKTRTLKIISRPFVTKGVVLYRADKGLIWDTRQPLRDVLFISKNGVSQFNPSNNAITRIDNPVVRSASDIFIALISLDPKQINAIFSVSQRDSEQGYHQYELIPRDETLKKVIRSIEVKGRKRIEQITILEQGGDSSSVSFSNEQFDVSVFSPAESDLFKLMP